MSCYCRELKVPFFQFTDVYIFAPQTISYMAERVVGHGSFGTVFQVCYYTNQYEIELSGFYCSISLSY